MSLYSQNALYSVGILYISALKYRTTAASHFQGITFHLDKFLGVEDCTCKNIDENVSKIYHIFCLHHTGDNKIKTVFP